MADVISSPVMERCAVVTGANRGIGFEICRKLAEEGIMVVMTARDEKKGAEALEKLTSNVEGLSDRVVFHQLDVTDPLSVVSLLDFIKSRFGKLDILINNAGYLGVTINGDALVLQDAIEENRSRAFGYSEPEKNQLQANGTINGTYESAEKCLQINYYGPKRMTEAFLPLLQLSDSPRIVNVSSFMGKLKILPDEHAISVLSDAESLTEERVDELINKFLKEFKRGSVQGEDAVKAYKLSKAALNAYTRITAKKYPTICVNCVCPGYVRTGMTSNTGRLSVEEGAEAPVKLALQPNDGPSGLYFLCQEVSSF